MFSSIIKFFKKKKSKKKNMLDFFVVLQFADRPEKFRSKFIDRKSFFPRSNREQDREEEDGMKETKHNGASNVSMESNSRRVHPAARP